jgi:hypothetical protein
MMKIRIQKSEVQKGCLAYNRLCHERVAAKFYLSNYFDNLAIRYNRSISIDDFPVNYQLAGYPCRNRQSC